MLRPYLRIWDCKGDSWAPYYRIIFELLDRLCQIIENPSFLLILQLSSFQSKIILWNDFWSSLNVILSKILKKGNFLKKMPKTKKLTTTIFYCCSFKSKKVTLYFRWNAVFVMISFASVLAKFCPNQNLELIRRIAAQFSTSTNIQACLISTWLCLQIDTLKCILLYLFFTHSSLSNLKT